MINTGKSINILSIAFLIVFISGFLWAGQLDLPEPDPLQVSYLQGSREEKSQQCRNEIAVSLGEECSSCHNNEVADLTEKGNRAKRDMKASIAIGAQCSYCHAGRDKFTKKFKIADKMFKLSEVMDVECGFCHKGKGVLAFKGRTARTAMLLQKWTKTGNKKCLECHVEKKQFELNSKGKETLKCLIHDK